jgi:hypothetical protein
MALLFIFPIWEKGSADIGVRYTLNAFYWQQWQFGAEEGANWQLVNTRSTFYLAGLAALSCLIALYSIFQFKKRMLQIKLGAINAFVIMAYVATATYFIYQGENEIGQQVRGVFRAGYFLPLGGLLFNSLANRFIKKDEKLVRSSFDRIR